MHCQNLNKIIKRIDSFYDLLNDIETIGNLSKHDKLKLLKISDKCEIVAEITKMIAAK